MSPYASVCAHMHPSRIRMHPFASKRIHDYASECEYNTPFIRKQASTVVQDHQIMIVIGSVKLLWIQPNIPMRANIGNKANKQTKNGLNQTAY